MEKQYNVKDIIAIVRKQGFEVTRNKLIHYERNKLVVPAYSKGGYRNYSEENVKDILLICYFLDVGWSIKEIFMIFSYLHTTKQRIQICRVVNEIFDRIEGGGEPSKEELKKVESIIDSSIPGTKEREKSIAHVVEVSDRKSKCHNEITKIFYEMKCLLKEESSLSNTIVQRMKKPSIKKVINTK